MRAERTHAAAWKSPNFAARRTEPRYILPDMMLRVHGWRLLVAGFLLTAPFACSTVPEFNGNDSSGGSGGTATGGTSSTGGGTSAGACVTLFPEACGQECAESNPCPEGMFCNSGTCDAACGPGFPCSGGRECTEKGRCSGELDVDPPEECVPLGCAELGFECGVAVDNCGKPRNCEEEDGLSCGSGLRCQAVEVEDDETGDLVSQNKCVAGGLECEVCDAIPDCSAEEQVTALSGRVVTPGRSDDDTANQLGIPNAIVYLLREASMENLPAMDTGIPDGGTSCDRCEDQDLGPVLAGAVTDASGYFEITSGNVPVGRDVVLVVKAGKFRRASIIQVPQACQDKPLPENVADNPARLPRDMGDGLAVNIPHIAVATGQIDAMECVFLKMGISESEFTEPAGTGRIHLYRSNGGWPSSVDTECVACAACNDNTCRQTNCTGCADCTAQGGGCTTCQADVVDACDLDGFLDGIALERLIEDGGQLDEYDLSVLDCEGMGWSIDAGGTSQHLREYVNRGGRLFASHLSFKWLRSEKDEDPNVALDYDQTNPIATGLGNAATWDSNPVSTINDGTGIISLDSPNASPRIDNFAEWMEAEGVTSQDENYAFEIIQPRSQALSLGPSTEEFVHCDDTGPDSTGDCSEVRTQQFSFNTPYGAPDDAACGRVAYSGFHVAATGGTLDLSSSVFPAYCTNAAANDGVLTDQEKILLYMLVDLGACVGDPPVAPPCVPLECSSEDCGFHVDGCGGILDCGACDDPVPK